MTSIENDLNPAQKFRLLLFIGHVWYSEQKGTGIVSKARDFTVLRFDFQKPMARRRDGAQYLFNDYDLDAVVETRRQRMKEAIDAADAEGIRSGDLEELTQGYASQFSLDVPELIEGAISVEVDEAQIDVRHDPMRMVMDRSRPAYVSGIRARYHVPVQGDPDLFKCRPNRFSGVIPAAHELGANELVFAVERPDTDVAATKAAFEHELAEVKKTLGWVRERAQTFNESLPADVRQRIVARRERLQQMDKGIGSLGVPIRKPATPTGPTRTNAPAPPPPKPVEKYDVALSFAGEDRDYVEAVAEGLKNHGVSVFYDKFETAGLWGKNLVDHLAEVYKNRSRYVVMFISKAYVEKVWTTHERQHAQERALVAKDEYILPARFDDTEVPGMTSTVGYVSLRDLPPDRLVELILTKLGRAKG
jgi:hypothetical protein